MAAEAAYRLNLSLTGLGQLIEANYKATTTATPTRSFYQYMQQASADTAEALAVGDVGTIELVLIKCITNDAAIDTSFSSTFNEEITVQEGEIAIFKPSGTLYLKNNDSGEQSTIEYYIIGTA